MFPASAVRNVRHRVSVAQHLSLRLLTIPTAAFLSLSLSAPVVHAQADTTYVANRVVITFSESYTPTQSDVTPNPPSVNYVPIDELFFLCGATSMRKLIPSFDYYTTEPGRTLERTYVLDYSEDIDPVTLAADWSALSYFDTVTVDEILDWEIAGTKRMTPGDTTMFANQWYFDNSDEGDKSDIDMPEAWAIEEGDSNLVLGIFDTGVAFDTSGATWRVHSDFNYHWITEEDSLSPGVLSSADIDGIDNNGDGVGTNPWAYKSNIIGFNLLVGFDADTTAGAEYRKLFWHGFPHSWKLQMVNCVPSRPCPNSWDIQSWDRHGVWVASIAAGKLDGLKVGTQPFGKDVVGVAHGCRVYWGRFSGAQASTDMANAIEHLSKVARVVNMSFGGSTQNSLVQAATITATRNNDCVLVAASGNDDPSVNYPAKYDSVMSIGAVNRNPLELASFSNYTPGKHEVDVVAPDDELPVMYADSYTLCSGSYPCSFNETTENIPEQGTSFAAPQAAGVAALVRSRFPGLTQYQVKERIRRGAEYYWQSDPIGTEKYGAGKLNAYRSLTEHGTLHGESNWTQNTLPPLFQNGIWTGRAGSRDGKYYLSGDLVIAPNSTLTIDPGTLVLVAPDHDHSGSDTTRVEIVVEGTLNAVGTSSDPIIFESFTDSAPQADDWVGIEFRPGSSAVLKHVIIRNASQDIAVDEFTISVADWDTTKTLYLNSDLAITSDFTVAAEESLFVLGASDVIVTGGNDVDITVEGTLISKGSSTKKPEFRSSTGQASSWELLTLAEGSENNVFHNTIFRDAEQAIRTFVPLTVDSCTFSDGIGGIQNYDDVTVTNSVFHDIVGAAITVVHGDFNCTNIEAYNGNYGILASPSGGSSTDGMIRCESSHFHDLWRGLDVYYPSDSLIVANTLIEDVSDGALISHQSYARVDTCTIRRANYGVLAIDSTSVALTHTVVEACTTNGLYAAFFADVAIQACRFVGNDIGVWVDSSLVAITSSSIDSSTTSGMYLDASSFVTLVSDTVSNGPVGVYFDHLSAGSIQDTSRVTYNTLAIKCDNGSTPTLRNSLFGDNGAGVAVLNDGNPDLGHATSGGDTCNAGGPDIGMNSFRNTTGLYVSNLNSTITIAAEGNYWGIHGPKANKFWGPVDNKPWLCDDPQTQEMSLTFRIPPGNDPAPKLPKVFALGPSRPNPFNPTTTMSFDVPAPAGRVDIAIYDVAGRRVKTLVNDTRAPGVHQVTWDGYTDRGQPVASGVYFVKMTARSFTQTRKIVLLK